MVENGAVADASSAANGDTTSPSARERISQSVDVPVVTGSRKMEEEEMNE